MSAELNRIELASLAKIGGVRAWSKGVAAFPLKRGLWLPAAVAAGFGLWLLVPGSDDNVALSKPAQAKLATAQPEPAAEPVGSSTGATAPPAAELDRLRISSQTWRRGGLGSKALVTLTLRNDNDYPVKDVEISCAFDRRDGSHLTDRRRLLPGTVSLKSRKTYPRVLVGFINVNANRASCTLVAAKRA